RMPRSLILAPTRELAAQVAESFEKYGVNHKLTVALLIGGVSMDEQVRKLDRGVDVLIATPGRLLDHFQRGRIMLMGVEILVIDEADRMLDMGFIHDIRKVLARLPQTRQTLMFSATFSKSIRKLAGTLLDNPAQIEVAPRNTTAAQVEQVVHLVDRDRKRDLLSYLIGFNNWR
ncbi:MAG: DEAD/DEAH box helicase, partial [Pseudomonadota bacterium]